MNDAVLMASHVEGLEAENIKQKRKRAAKRKYIAKGGVLLVAYGISLSEQGKSVQVEQEEDVELLAAGPCPRAPRRCSLCRSLDRTARTCAQRDIII